MTDVKKTIAGGVPWASYPESAGNAVKLYALASEDAKGTAGAFADLEQAIKDAQIFIFIADWSFQPYVRLRNGSAPTVENTVGYLLVKKAREDGVLVAIHSWNHTDAGAPDPQNDETGARLDAIARTFDSKLKNRPANLLWRISSRTGIGWSHHQKFVVLDAPGSGGKRIIKAFWGGLDITQGRFDWTEHPILTKDAPALRSAVIHDGRSYDEWYSAEFRHAALKPDPKTATPGLDEGPGDARMPRQPWQDFYAQIAGPAAWDLVREFVGRWLRDHGGFVDGDADALTMTTVQNLFIALFSKKDLVKPWEKQDGPFVARVVRSLEQVHWGPQDRLFTLKDIVVAGEKEKQKELVWSIGSSYEKSIQEAYLRAIARAERFIYIETQYFIGSGASWVSPRESIGNGVPKAIADRIVAKIDAGQEFHAYIVVPMFPEGSPVDAPVIAQRNFEFRTMEFMILEVSRAAQAKGKDWRDFLSFYFLARYEPPPGPLAFMGTRAARVRTNARYMIYVHSKLMIIDDEYLIVGSANLNERSLAGDRDSEICIYLRPGEGKLSECRMVIQDLRRKTWTQHLGVLPPAFENPHQAACVSAIREKARDAWKELRVPTATTCHLVAFPFKLGAAGKSVFVEAISASPAEDPFLVDAEAKVLGASAAEWFWSAPLTLGAKGAAATDVAE